MVRRRGIAFGRWALVAVLVLWVEVTEAFVWPHMGTAARVWGRGGRAVVFAGELDVEAIRKMRAAEIKKQLSEMGE